MSKLIAYKKETIDGITHSLTPPMLENPFQWVELCNLPDGKTIVSLIKDIELPEQAECIKASIEYLPDPLPAELRKEICAASYVINYIDKCTQEKIAERYSMADEIKLLRTKNKEKLKEYNQYVEECITEGKTKKAVYGL